MVVRRLYRSDFSDVGDEDKYAKIYTVDGALLKYNYTGHGFDVSNETKAALTRRLEMRYSGRIIETREDVGYDMEIIEVTGYTIYAHNGLTDEYPEHMVLKDKK